MTDETKSPTAEAAGPTDECDECLFDKEEGICLGCDLPEEECSCNPLEDYY